MRKYMWPNSCLPSATALITAAQTACEGRFTLQSVENHAAHYPRTLREWGRRLENNLSQEIIASEHPALSDPATYEAFKRKWQYLFAYAGAGFAKGYITCHMLCFNRQVSSAELEAYERNAHLGQQLSLCSGRYIDDSAQKATDCRTLFIGNPDAV